MLFECIQWGGWGENARWSALYRLSIWNYILQQYIYRWYPMLQSSRPCLREFRYNSNCAAADNLYKNRRPADLLLYAHRVCLCIYIYIYSVSKVVWLTRYNTFKSIMCVYTKIETLRTVCVYIQPCAGTTQTWLVFGKYDINEKRVETSTACNARVMPIFDLNL